MPALELKPGRPVTLRVQQGAQARDFPITAQDSGSRTLDLTWSKGAPAAVTSDQEYHLVWADEFNKDGRPSPANWKFETGFVRNNELQWYQPQNAICQNGNLIIEARREHKANPNFKKQGKGWQTNREFIEYTSSCLITRGLHSWKFGRFEVRAKIRTQDGLWPAIWFLGIDGGWPNGGEIDLMEYYQGLILANACWGSEKRGQATWDSSKKPVSSFGDAKWDEKFHVWRMDWDSESIQLYLDDMLLNSIDLTKTLNPAGAGPENPFLQPQYLLLNLAIGGTCGGNPSETPFPSRFEIDYVRVYQKDPGGK